MIGNTHRIYIKKDICVIEVYNLLNEIENKQILEAVKFRIAKGFTNFVVDFSKLKLMNSVGLSFLINLKHNIEGINGKLVLINIDRSLLRLLLITKVYPMFVIKPSFQTALKTL